MIQIWWGFLRFLRAVFIPPKFSELEEYLTNQVTHLESQLAQERERYAELSMRIMFPDQQNLHIPTGPISLEPPVNKDNVERQRLENLSKQRWMEHIERQEQRAAELMKLDETRAEEARNEKAAGQSP